MAFRAKKVYCQRKQDSCAFCGSIATQTTEAGVLFCRHHREAKLDEIKCTCGSWLEQKSGKFGPYFRCTNCGNIGFNKAMEMKALMPATKNEKKPSSFSLPNPLSMPKQSLQKEEAFEDREKRIRREERRGTETTITSDDVEYFD